MLKLNMIILIAVILTSGLYAQEYKPMTESEARNYIMSAYTDALIMEQLILDVIRLDYLENTVPMLPDPMYTAVLDKKGNLTIFPLNPYMIVEWGHLQWEVNYQPYYIQNFYRIDKSEKITLYITLPIVGFLLGFFTGLYID